jgi:hypothetical protein
VLACNADCTLNAAACRAFCGDFTLNGPEVCDGADFAFDCNEGVLACSPDCSRLVLHQCPGGFCGDGLVDAGEQCDLDRFDRQCWDGVFACNACALDDRQCRAYCGDALKNGPEACDADDVPRCHDGFFVCRDDCTLDGARCRAYCGDGLLNGNEECDGDAGLPACPTPGGRFRCLPDCYLDATLCPDG